MWASIWRNVIELIRNQVPREWKSRAMGTGLLESSELQSTLTGPVILAAQRIVGYSSVFDKVQPILRTELGLKPGETIERHPEATSIRRAPPPPPPAAPSQPGPASGSVPADSNADSGFGSGFEDPYARSAAPPAASASPPASASPCPGYRSSSGGNRMVIYLIGIIHTYLVDWRRINFNGHAPFKHIFKYLYTT